jgi:hypothetical protein
MAATFVVWMVAEIIAQLEEHRRDPSRAGSDGETPETSGDPRDIPHPPEVRFKQIDRRRAEPPPRFDHREAPRGLRRQRASVSSSPPTQRT